MVKTRHILAISTVCLIVLVSGPWQGLAATSGHKTNTDCEWIWVTNTLQAHVYAYNIKTGQVVGPLGDRLMGTRDGQIFDIAVTPDGKTAMVSNFGDSLVSFWDVTYPAVPVYLGGLLIGHFAEDMAVTHDGKYVLVTDGGFSSVVTVIEINSRKVVYDKPNLPGYLNAVAVAPNGTVLGADYFQGMIHVMTIDDYGQITWVKSINERPYSQGFGARPVNIEISPDGQTAITAIAGDTVAEVLWIQGKGQVTHTTFITGLCRNTQSIVFSDDGKYAYGIHNFYDIAKSNEQFRLSKIRIDGPGQATLENPEAYWAHPGGTSQLFGVDCMAYVDGKIYLGNPTVSGATFFAQQIDLSTGNVTKIVGPHGSFLPTGLCAIRTPKTPVGDSLALTSPAQGAKWKIGSAQKIEWTQEGLTGNVVISLYKKGVLLGTIATVPVTDLQYAWNAGQYKKKTAKAGWYTIKISTEDGAHSDTSPSFKLTR